MCWKPFNETKVMEKIHHQVPLKKSAIDRSSSDGIRSTWFQITLPSKSIMDFVLHDPLQWWECCRPLYPLTISDLAVITIAMPRVNHYYHNCARVSQGEKEKAEGARIRCNGG